MRDVTSMTPEEIKLKVSNLQQQLDHLTNQAHATERKIQVVYGMIRDLQSECPHKNTTRDFVQDVAVMKLRPFCTDCRTEL